MYEPSIWMNYLVQRNIDVVPTPFSFANLIVLRLSQVRPEVAVFVPMNWEIQDPESAKIDVLSIMMYLKENTIEI